MKFKIVGIINLLVGISYIAFVTLLNFFVYPQLLDIYEQFQVEANVGDNVLIATIVLIILGLTNLYFAIKLFQKDNKHKEKYYNYALIVIVGSILLSSILVGLLVWTLITPIRFSDRVAVGFSLFT